MLTMRIMRTLIEVDDVSLMSLNPSPNVKNGPIEPLSRNEADGARTRNLRIDSPML